MNSFKKNVSNIWDAVKKVFEGITTFVSGVFAGDWKKAWTGVKQVFKGIFDGLVAVAKSPLNLIIGLINGMLSGVFKGMNWLIKQVNRFSIDVPDWVPKIRGKKWGFNIGTIDADQFKIPLLAQGGYVKANTPQLAMIGDNRHQGEVVAPEGKLYEVMSQVLKDFTKQSLSQGSSTQQDRDVNLTLNLVLGEQKFRSEVIKAVNKDRRLNGKSTIKFT